MEARLAKVKQRKMKREGISELPEGTNTAEDKISHLIRVNRFNFLGLIFYGVLLLPFVRGLSS